MSTFAIRLRFLSFAGGPLRLRQRSPSRLLLPLIASTPPAPAGVMPVSNPQSITPPLTM
jgi:hypothetical protein